MSRNAWLAVGVVVGSLAAALVVRALRPAEPEPEAPTTPAAVSAPDELPAPRADEHASARPHAADEAAPPAPAVMDGQPPPPSATAGAAAPADEPPPMADDPFATEDSRELDYAFHLVLGPESTVESARAAAEVFQRCLEAAPDNHRCYRGLVAAQERQRPGWTPPAPASPLAPSAPRPRPTFEVPRGIPSVRERPTPGPGRPLDDLKPITPQGNPQPPDRGGG